MIGATHSILSDRAERRPGQTAAKRDMVSPSQTLLLSTIEVLARSRSWSSSCVVRSHGKAAPAGVCAEMVFVRIGIGFLKELKALHPRRAFRSRRLVPQLVGQC